MKNLLKTVGLYLLWLVLIAAIVGVPHFTNKLREANIRRVVQDELSKGARP